MARRRRSKNPTGWSPLVIGLVGVGVYLAYRKWRGLGNGDYGITKPVATRPKPVTVPLKPKPAPSPFWTRAKEVAALPFQTAPAEPVISSSTQQQIFEQVNKLAQEILARQPAAAPQYKVMEQVDFSIDEKPKSQMEKLQEYGKQPWMIEKERQAAQDRPKSVWKKLAERGAEESVKIQEMKAQEAKELLGPPMTLEIPKPIPLSYEERMAQWQEIQKRGREAAATWNRGAENDAMKRARAQMESQLPEAISRFENSLKADVKSLEAADADHRTLRAEYNLEKDPDEKAKLAKAVEEMGNLNYNEKIRVGKKINEATEHIIAAGYEETYPDIAVKFEQKIRQAADRVIKRPVSTVAFTPTQRAMTKVSMDDEFGM